MDMNPEATIGLIIAIATALGLREWLPGIVQQVTGKASRERQHIQEEATKAKAEREAELTRARQERDAAERLADIEACQRRMMQEYASRLRRRLIDVGGEIPPYPDLNRCKENP